MQNLYVFEIPRKLKVFVCAPTWKEARNIVFKNVSEFHQVAMLTEIEGRSLKRKCTERTGIVSIDDVCREMPWWVCRCGSESFTSINDGSSCRCVSCGREMRIITPERSK